MRLGVLGLCGIVGLGIYWITVEGHLNELSYILNVYCKTILNFLKKGYTSFIFKEIFTLCLNCHFACCAFDEHQLIAHTRFAADAQIFGLTKYMVWTLSKSFRIINWLCERAPNGYAINKGNYSVLFAWITTMLYVAATHICRRKGVCTDIYLYIYLECGPGVCLLSHHHHTSTKATLCLQKANIPNCYRVDARVI